MYGLLPAKHRGADARTRHSEPCAILSSKNRYAQTTTKRAGVQLRLKGARIAVQAVKAWLDSRAADEPGADMHVIFDVYTEQDENLYRAILGEDEKPASDTEE